MKWKYKFFLEVISGARNGSDKFLGCLWIKFKESHDFSSWAANGKSKFCVEENDADHDRVCQLYHSWSVHTWDSKQSSVTREMKWKYKFFLEIISGARNGSDEFLGCLWIKFKESHDSSSWAANGKSKFCVEEKWRCSWSCLSTIPILTAPANPSKLDFKTWWSCQII